MSHALAPPRDPHSRDVTFNTTDTGPMSLEHHNAMNTLGGNEAMYQTFDDALKEFRWMLVVFGFVYHPTRLGYVWWWLARLFLLGYAALAPYVTQQLANSTNQVLGITLTTPMVVGTSVLFSLSLFWQHTLYSMFRDNFLHQLARHVPFSVDERKRIVATGRRLFIIIFVILLLSWFFFLVQNVSLIVAEATEHAGGPADPRAQTLEGSQLDGVNIAGLVVSDLLALWWRGAMACSIFFFVLTCQFLEAGITTISTDIEMASFRKFVNLKDVVNDLSLGLDLHIEFWRSCWLTLTLTFTSVLVFALLITTRIADATVSSFATAGVCIILLPPLYIVLRYPARVNARLRELMSLEHFHTGYLHMVDDQYSSSMEMAWRDSATTLRSEGSSVSLDSTNSGNSSTDGGRNITSSISHTELVAMIALLQYSKSSLVWRAYGVIIDNGLITRIVYLGISFTVVVLSS